MKEIMTNQKLLKMKSSIQRIHHAVQLIAFFSNSYLPLESDDSHTNFKWNPIEDRFMSQTVNMPGAPNISIDCNNLKVYFNLHDKEAYQIDLSRIKRKEELNEEINIGLNAINLDLSKYKEELHYELPSYIDLDTTDFKIDKASASHFAYLQNKAYEIIGIFQKQYESASSLKIWPHHFDHSTDIPFKNSDGEIDKSISIGLGIPDQYVDEPYFYVSHWLQEGSTQTSETEKLPFGKWHSDGWLAAVFPHAELHTLEQENHIEVLYDFFAQAIAQSKRLISAS